MSKLFILLSIIGTSVTSFAVEQCIVQNLPNRVPPNTVISINLPDPDSDPLIQYNGYRLECNVAEEDFCINEVKVNAQNTRYVLSGNEGYIAVKRDTKNKLTGPGEFKSLRFTKGKRVVLKCLELNKVPH